MDFRLLGPLEVVEHDRPLALGGPKRRALLAVLLLHANDVVSTERLIDLLWGESPPSTVAKSVQTYVSRLRKELGDGRLLTRTRAMCCGSIRPSSTSRGSSGLSRRPAARIRRARRRC